MRVSEGSKQVPKSGGAVVGTHRNTSTNRTDTGGFSGSSATAWRREVVRAARVRSRGSRGIYRRSQGSKCGRGSPGVMAPDWTRSRHRARKEGRRKRRKEKGDACADRWVPPVGGWSEAVRGAGLAGLRCWAAGRKRRRGEKRGSGWAAGLLGCLGPKAPWVYFSFSFSKIKSNSNFISNSVN